VETLTAEAVNRGAGSIAVRPT